jgi:hypothetical protein
MHRARPELSAAPDFHDLLNLPFAGRLGKVQVLHDKPYFRHVLLYDFDVDSAALRPFHRHWLDRDGRRMRTAKMTAHLVGFTSTTGSESHNMGLSLRRVEAVRRHIENLAPGLPFSAATFWNGETAARIAGLPDGHEDERWRGVLVMLIDLTQIPQSRVLPPPPPLPTFVRKPYSVKLEVEQIAKGNAIVSSEERAFQAGMAISRYVNGLGTFNWEHAPVDASWVLNAVILVKSDIDVGNGIARVSLSYVHVTYVWGPSRGTRTLIDPFGRSEPLTSAHAEKWLKQPMRMYMERKWLPAAWRP